ncbi:MAG: diaminopimelate epimerase [Clostridia bacterium]|nr:diaminopimelate epimerase [Clostridia bacterium]
MRFTKMQGLGNDFLIFSGGPVSGAAEAARALCDRVTGFGADGIIFVFPCPEADFEMRIFNSDGGEALMCGNGIRCAGRWFYDRRYTEKTELRVKTKSGIKTVFLHAADGEENLVTVDMGTVKVGEKERIAVCGKELEYFPANAGNPHAVIFTDEAETADIARLGAELSGIVAPGDGINVEFAKAVSETGFRMRVYERGCGVTSACGTGACACAAAAAKAGLCLYETPLTATLDGGELELTVLRDSRVLMKGPAEYVFEGETVSP